MQGCYDAAGPRPQGRLQDSVGVFGPSSGAWQRRVSSEREWCSERRPDGRLAWGSSAARAWHPSNIQVSRRWGYVEPTEAAWELLGEAVEVYDGQVARLLKLGMVRAATDTALGLVAGLYRCRGCEDGDLLLSWAPDFPWEHACSVLGVLGQAQVELPQEFVAAAAPEWAESLSRVVGTGG